MLPQIDVQKLLARKRQSGEPLNADELAALLENYLVKQKYDLAWTQHAKNRMTERDITIPNVIYLLKNDYNELQETKACNENKEVHPYKLYQYTVCGLGLESSRRIKVVIIPSLEKPALKIVTVMWEDPS